MSTNGTNTKPSFIQNLLRGSRRKAQDVTELVDREIDGALERLQSALEENAVASASVRRRQSSGSLKLVSLPEYEGAE